MLDLDLTTLRLFVAVCEHASMSRAAEEAHLVASAVSKRLAALQAQLGTALLQRRPHGVVPTPAGELLLQHARSMLLSARRIERDLAGLAAGIDQRVNVLGTASALAESLSEDIAHFLQARRHQHIRIDIEERVSDRVVQGVRDGEAELGVLWDRTDTGALRTHPYGGDRLCVVVPPGHALARLAQVRFAQTLAHEHVTLPPTAAVTVLLQQQAQALGLPLRQRVIVTHIEAKLRVVRAGLGIAILPDEVVAAEARAGHLVTVPLAEPWAERRFVICHRDDDSLSAAAQELLQALCQAAAQRERAAHTQHHQQVAAHLHDPTP
jgi:DNA-binding transcriptional LysR family regulator